MCNLSIKQAIAKVYLSKHQRQYDYISVDVFINTQSYFANVRLFA